MNINCTFTNEFLHPHQIFKNHLEPGLRKVCHVAGGAFYQFAWGLKKISQSQEGRMHAHQFVLGTMALLEHVSGPFSPFPLVRATLEVAESVFNAIDVFGVSHYFAHQQNNGPQFANKKGFLEVKNKNYDTTQFRHDLSRGKYEKITSMIGVGIGSFSSMASLLNRIGVISLSTLATHFGKVPLFGRALASVCSVGGLASLGLVGGSLYHVSKIIGSVQYLAKAYEGDSTKDLTKGWLVLSSNVSGLALCGALFIGISNPVVLGGLLVTAGTLSVTSFLYRENRVEEKAVEQERLQKAFSKIRV